MNWYSAADAPELVEFGPVRGLSVTGQGEPGGSLHTSSIQALYSVAGPLLGIAAAGGAPFEMPSLEGRWWVEDERPPLDVPRPEWWWHLFLRLPADAWADEWFDEARQASDDPAAARVQLVTFTEGRCVQALHHGAYAEEPKTLALMEEFMERAGLVMNGLHHEIYLSDVEETDPARMRTILRHPVRAA
ncbi:GyrI-like domain-containing protein [Actinoallomurus sp. CA-150999]|uniref:GyrI-like domain-containing protein n=1 Tax=Actinoallomurus sp. CA-150999 TaxID=3239887 RepID=UPI003D8F0566